jgi:hypothetical protein
LAAEQHKLTKDLAEGVCGCRAGGQRWS